MVSHSGLLLLARGRRLLAASYTMSKHFSFSELMGSYTGAAKKPSANRAKRPFPSATNPQPHGGHEAAAKGFLLATLAGAR